MSLSVVAEEYTDRTGKVVVAGATQEEVMSMQARQMAVTQAAARLPRAGLSGNAVPYPVDAQGQTSDDLMLGRVQGIVGYHCEYPVAAGV